MHHHCFLRKKKKKRAEHIKIMPSYTHKTGKMSTECNPHKKCTIHCTQCIPISENKFAPFFPLFSCKKSQRINVLRFFKKYLNISWSNEWAALSRIELKTKMCTRAKTNATIESEWDRVANNHLTCKMKNLIVHTKKWIKFLVLFSLFV